MRSYGSWVAVVFGVAIAARLVRWGLGFPMWGDEIFVALNLWGMEGLGDVLRPLRPVQVAPPGFLLIELAILRGAGTGERILRLVPLLAGIAALIGFRQLARLVLRPFGREGALGGLLAVATFGVSYFAIRYCAELKPYSIDLLAATGALWVGAKVITEPSRSVASRWLLGFTLAAVPTLWFSYSSVFAVAGVGVAIFVAGLRGRVPVMLVLVSGVLIGGSFLLLYFGVMRPQVAGSTGASEFLLAYWVDAFPPGNPIRLPLWLLEAHTGTIFAYPNGGKNGGSTLTAILVAVGVAAWWRGPRLESAPAPDDARERCSRLVLTALLLPFAFNMLAAAMRLYPYGGHTRLALHLAPSVCLLAGLGAARLLMRIRTPARRRAAEVVAVSVLLLLGLGSIVRDLIGPQRFDMPLATRAFVRELRREAGSEGDIVSVNTRDDLTEFTRVIYGWYLLTEGGAQVHWPDDRVDLLGLGRPLLVVSYASEPGPGSAEAARAWRETEGAGLSPTQMREETVQLSKGHNVTVLRYRKPR